MNDLTGGLWGFLSNNLWVSGFAAAIAIVALIFYWAWFRPHVQELLKALEALFKALQKKEGGWPAVQQQARIVTKLHPIIRAAWEETEKRVIDLPPPLHGQTTLPVMFGVPRDIWSMRSLLAARLNIQLAEAVPNLLVGIGLLLTFVFLTLALTEATSALVSKSGEQADLLDATRGLLSAAGGKFITSLVGLFSSIIWTIFSKRAVGQVEAATEKILFHINEFVSTTGGEKAILSQIFFAKNLQHSTAFHIEISQNLLAKTESNFCIAEQLLEQSYKQIEIFKKFETNLAPSLAGAIAQSLAPPIEAMTDRLVNAIESLSQKMSTMNEDTLQKMLNDFSIMLTQSTKLEMELLRSTLENLADKLNLAGKTIGKEAENAAKALDGVGIILVTRIEESSTHFTSSIEGAGTALTASIAESSSNLVSSVENAAVVWNNGATHAAKVMDEAGASLVAGVQVASEGLANHLILAGQTIGKEAENAAKALDSVGIILVTRIEESSTHFTSSIECAGTALTASIAESSSNLVSSVENAVVVWNNGATHAAKVIDEAGASLVIGIQNISASLEGASGSVDNAMNNLGELICEITDLGKQGAIHLREGLQASDTTIERFSKIVGHLGEVIVGIQRASNEVTRTVENIEELSIQQKEVLNAVKEAAPNALATVERFSKALDESARQTAHLMTETRYSMESTAVSLGNTVASITEGVSVYSQEVAKLHINMDEQLAKAIGSIHTGVAELKEAIEDLEETLSSKHIKL